MHFSLLFLSLLTASSASPVDRRQAASSAPQLLTTITKLNNAVNDLTTAVNGFDGSLIGLLPQAFAIVQTEATLDSTILEATDITSKSANFTADESKSIVTTLATGIGPIQTSLNALKYKLPIFKKTLTSPIVLLDLNILKKHTDELIAALTAKVTADDAGLLGLGKGILDQSFDDAIAAFALWK